MEKDQVRILNVELVHACLNKVNMHVMLVYERGFVALVKGCAVLMRFILLTVLCCGQ